MSHIDKFGRFSKVTKNYKVIPFHSTHLRKLSISPNETKLDVGLLSITNMSMSPKPEVNDAINIEFFEARLKDFEHKFLRLLEHRFLTKSSFKDFEHLFVRAADTRYQKLPNQSEDIDLGNSHQVINTT